MNNTIYKEVLEKAIQKALDGGFRFKHPEWRVELFKGSEKLRVYSPAYKTEKGITWDVFSVSDILFNQEFARSLWGDDGRTAEGLLCSAEEGVVPYWVYHIQRLAAAPDRLAYIGKHS